MKKRVLVISSFSDLSMGGQKSTFLLLKKIDRSKFEPILLCPAEGEFTEQATKIGIKSIIFPLPSIRTFNIFRLMATIRQTKEILKENGIDLIHTEYNRATFYFGIPARQMSVPILWHVRVSYQEGFLYESLLYRLSSKIVAVSQATKDRFKRMNASNDKIAVVYNAIQIDGDVSRGCMEAFRAEVGVDGNILVGMVGQIIPLKGQHVFLQAAAEIIKKHPNIRFVIVGNSDKEYLNELMRLIEQLSLNKVVRILSFKKDIAPVISSLDVIVNASKMEGFSRIILEAMAARKPVVATSVGGNPEAVVDRKTGRLVEPNDSQQLASAMMDLIEDEKMMRRMGDAGRRRVEDLFDLEEHAQKIEKIYTELLN